jgi:hypothetical protein
LRHRLRAGLSRRCVRSGHLLLLDVTAEAALEGQHRRRRALRRSAFATHWRNFRQLRAEPPATAGPGTTHSDAATADADPAGLAGEGWASVRLLDRPAADRLRRIAIPPR